MGFAANLSRLMEYHNISMYRLAKEVGVHQTTVKNWLEGESEPKIAALEKIVGLLGVSYDELLGDVEYDPSRGSKGSISFVDDGSLGLTLVQLGPGGRDGVLYMPDNLLCTFARLNRKGVETVCDVADGLSTIVAYQRNEESPDPLDTEPPESPYDKLMREYRNYKGYVYKPSRDITNEPSALMNSTIGRSVLLGMGLTNPNNNRDQTVDTLSGHFLCGVAASPACWPALPPPPLCSVCKVESIFFCIC